MMKKIMIVALLTVMSMTSWALVTAQADVRWDGAEIMTGQTGKLSFVKDTKVYKKEADGTFTMFLAPKGSFYRVYGTLKTSVGPVYRMSGGYRVNASNLVTYRDIPLAVQNQLQIGVTEHIVSYPNETNVFVRYVQLSALRNEALQRQINQYMKGLADTQLRDYEAAVKAAPTQAENFTVQTTMSLAYNSNGYLTIAYDVYRDLGTARPIKYATAYHYNLFTSKHVNMSEFVKTPAQQQKLVQYVKTKLKAAPAPLRNVSITTIPASQPFYLTDEGIQLIFNEQDYGIMLDAPYTLFVPFTVFR